MEENTSLDAAMEGDTFGDTSMDDDSSDNSVTDDSSDVQETSEPEDKAAPKPDKTDKSVDKAPPKAESDDKVAKAELDKLKQDYESQIEATKKQVADFVKQLKTDPLSILTDKRLGVNFKEIAEDYLVKELEYELMSPEDKLAKYENERRQQMEEQQRTEQQQQFQKQVEYHRQQIDQQVGQVLSTSNLPKTPETVSRVINLMIAAKEQGVPYDLPAYVKQVEQSYQTELSSLISSWSGEQIVEFLGDNIEKIRKADIARIKTTPQPRPAPQTPTSRKPSQKVSADDFFSNLDF